MNSRVTDFKNQCRETFKDDLVEGMVNSRFSTGSYAVDKATGQLVRGRFHLWMGKESTCKTTLALHTMREMNQINWDTGEHDPSLESPSPVLFVDLEGTFDYDWADKIGIPRQSFDDYNYLVQPISGEMASNTILNAIESRAFGLIIVDSNEAFISVKTLEKAAEQDVVADRAKILARMYRAGQANLLHAKTSCRDMPWRVPTVLCLNQIREVIGSYMPTWIPPGGRTQLQYSSSIIQFNSPLVVDSDKKNYGIGEFKGVTKKNKTAPPKKNFTFRMALKDTDEMTAGQIDNASSILRDIKDLNLMEKTKNGYLIFGDEYEKQADFKDKVRADLDFQRKIWNYLLEIDKK